MIIIIMGKGLSAVTKVQQQVEKSYIQAKETYAKWGVDTDQVLES